MATYILRRVAIAVPVFFLITMSVFFLVRQAPGDPLTMLIDPEAASSGGQDYIDRRRVELGLDDPLAVQYLNYTREVLSGNLGYSIFSRRPVSEMLAERFPPTLILMGTALAVGLVVSIPLGVLAAVRQNSLADYSAAVVSLSFISIPSFFLALLSIHFFSLTLGWLPSAGMGPPGEGNWVFSVPHLIMPAGILGLVLAARIMRFVRGSLLDELDKPYVKTAMAKGSSRSRAIARHALRNALLPLITVLAIYIPQLLAGAVILEQVFAWPGLGQLAVSSISQRDFPVITGFAMVVALLVLLSNLLADVLYSIADPRIKLR